MDDVTAVMAVVVAVIDVVDVVDVIDVVNVVDVNADNSGAENNVRRLAPLWRITKLHDSLHEHDWRWCFQHPTW